MTHAKTLRALAAALLCELMFATAYAQKAQVPGKALASGAAAANLGFTPSKVFNAVSYGAVCNGSSASADTAAINAAVTAAAAAGGGIVSLPSGVCNLSTTITVAVNSVLIAGQGENATTVTPTGAFDAFDFGYISNATVSHVGLRDLSIIWSSTPSSGYCFGVLHVYYAQMQNVFCQNSNSGAAVGPSYYGDYTNVRFLSSYLTGSTGHGLYIYGDSNTIGTGNWPISNNFNDWYFLSPATGGFDYNIYDTASEDTNFVNLYSGNGTYGDFYASIQAVSGSINYPIENTRFVNPYIDATSAAHGGCAFYLVGNSNGTIVDTTLTNLTASGEGPFVTTGAQQGICTSGASGTVAKLTINGANILAWNAAGINLQTGSDIQLNGVSLLNNNYNNANSSPGIDVGPSVVGLSANGLKSGGSIYGTEYQKYGVYIESGASRVNINGGDLTGNVTGAVLNNNTVTTSASQINITNMIGFNGARTTQTTPCAASGVTQFNPFNSPATLQVYGGSVSSIALNGASFNSTTSAIFSVGSQDKVVITGSGYSCLWWPQ